MAAKQNSDISHEGWVVIQIFVDRAQVFTTVPQQKPGNELVITFKVYILWFSFLHFFQRAMQVTKSYVPYMHLDFKSFIMLKIHQYLKKN